MLWSHWAAGEKAGDGTRFCHRLTWPRTPSITLLASGFWLSGLSFPSTGIRAVPPQPVQNHHFSLKNIFKTHRCLYSLYNNFLPYQHFKGPQETGPPRRSQSTHRIRGRAAGSRLLTHSPKPSNALQLPVSPCPRMAPSSIDSAWPSFEPLVCHLPGVVSFDRGDQNCLWHDF